MPSQNPPDATSIIDLTSDDELIAHDRAAMEDDEDESLKLAIALSLEAESDIAAAAAPTKPTTLTAHNTVAGLAGLNRKQMEAERLARKRKHDSNETLLKQISPPPQQRVRKVIDVRIPRADAATKKITAPYASGPIEEQSNYSGDQSTFGLTYPDGKILLTSADATMRGAVSMSDLLRPPNSGMTLRSALLSTFVFDFDWLFPHFDTRSVSFVLILHAASAEHRALLQNDFSGIGNVRLHFPPVSGIINCMHSKLMLLFFEGGGLTTCRVVVPTANLTPADWGAFSTMENAVFVVDGPQTNTATNDPFKERIVEMLSASHVAGEVIRKFRQYSFPPDIAFIHSIGGSHLLHGTTHTSSSLNSYIVAPRKTSQDRSSLNKDVRTGLHAMSDAVQSLGFAVTPEAQSLPRLDYITSSLGNLKTTFLQNLMLAVCGHGPETPTNKPKGKSQAKNSSTVILAMEDVQSRLRIYFPSDRTIRRSRGGPAAAGTICFQSGWWDAASSSGFPTMCLRDCIGARNDGILMHSKILYVRFASPMISIGANRASEHKDERDVVVTKNGDQDLSDPDGSRLFAGWVYVGSANLSESAWGAIVSDTKTKAPKLNVRNYESGVILPVPLSKQAQLQLDKGRSLHDMTLKEVFSDVVPVPICEPAESYEDGRKPWFFNS